MEVRSEPGVTSAREPLSVATQKTAPSSQPAAAAAMPNMRLTHTSDGTVIYKPIATISSPPYQGVLGGGSGTVAVAVAGGGGGGGGHSLAVPPQELNFNMGERLKRKRGRPRKYRPDGAMAAALTPVPPAVREAPSCSVAFSLTSPARVASQISAPASLPAFKKVKGRPPSSGRKEQMDALGSGGIGFTPHVITVKAGEDVSSKIMSFSQHGPRAVCILSANGAISNVTLRQAATSGGTVTYEGRFEILSLSGSFLLSESDGRRSRTGGLSVSLAGPDGRVLGGGVAGLLTAASPVQVVVGSFIVDGRHEAKPNNQSDLIPAPSKLVSGGMSGPASPPSRGTVSESSGGPGSPLNLSTGACNDSNQQGMSGMPWK